jgi:simple sugar transport system ATP-binding protein
VARSVAWASKVVFLDEPTAALGVVQTGRVLETVKRIRDRGVAAVLISHNMRQVLEIADRIEVLRLGRRVARFAAKDATIEKLVSAMTGGLAEEGAA